MDDFVLYVGNLHPRVTEDLLFELFLQAGPLKGVEKKDSYAFVTFRHKESVYYAAMLFDDTCLYNRPIRAKPRLVKDQTRKIAPSSLCYNELYDPKPANQSYQPAQYNPPINDIYYNQFAQMAGKFNPQFNIALSSSSYSSQPTQHNNHKNNQTNSYNQSFPDSLLNDSTQHYQSLQHQNFYFENNQYSQNYQTQLYQQHPQTQYHHNDHRSDYHRTGSSQNYAHSDYQNNTSSLETHHSNYYNQFSAHPHMENNSDLTKRAIEFSHRHRSSRHSDPDYGFRSSPKSHRSRHRSRSPNYTKHSNH